MLYVEQLLSGNVYPGFRGYYGDGDRRKLRPIPQTDIGVISTYRAQCKVLRHKFRQREWFGIKVGTVDSFQGEEKPVIIVSTVRSQSDNAGFLHNERVSLAEICFEILIVRSICSFSYSAEIERPNYPCHGVVDHRR